MLLLFQLAFEGLKPFPKRRDITSKQTCYLNTLKEKHKKKELQRLAFAEREQLVGVFFFFFFFIDPDYKKTCGLLDKCHLAFC